MYDSTERFSNWQSGSAVVEPEYLTPSKAFMTIVNRNVIDDGHYLELASRFTPDDYAILKLAGITLDQFEYGELEDIEQVESAIYRASLRYQRN